MRYFLKKSRQRIASRRWVRVFIFSALVGCIAGLGAVTLQVGLHFVWASFTEVWIAKYWWLMLVIPTVGGLIAGVLVFSFAPEAAGDGTDSAIEAFHWRQGLISGRVPIIKALASICSIGSGGSAGKEGPITQIGAGFGSFLARVLRLGVVERRQLVLSGMAGGIGAIFRAPLGGAIFAAEVLYQGAEFEAQAIVPCVLSSIVAYSVFIVVYPLFLAGRMTKHVFRAPANIAFDDPKQLLLYFGLGIFCALMGRLFVVLFYGTKDKLFERISIPPMLKPALGGFCIGLLGLLDPRSLAVGYDAVQSAIDGKLLLGNHAISAWLTDSWGLSAAGAIAVVALVLASIKILTTSLTLGSGGSGGVFGPSVFIGAMLGTAFGYGVSAVLPALCPPAARTGLVLVGMGGFFAGVGKVPLTALILVSEISGSYDLLVPLMLTCFTAFIFSGARTIYVKQVRVPLDSPAHLGEYEKSMLEQMTCGDAVAHSPGCRTVRRRTTLRALLKLLSDTRQTLLPVVDKNDKLTGIISTADVAHIKNRDVLADIVVADELARPAETLAVHVSDSFYTALRLMTEHNTRELPVVDDHEEGGGKLLGLLNYNAIVSGYHEELQKIRDTSHIDDSGSL